MKIQVYQIYSTLKRLKLIEETINKITRENHDE